MKQFFIDHTEKVVLGLCLALAAYLLYSSMTVEPYDKRAEDFQAAISNANRAVMSSKPNVAELTPPDFDAELAKVNRVPDPKKYPLSKPYRRAVELGYKFRDQPQILRPDNIQVLSNGGLVLLLDRDPKTKGDAKVFASLLASRFPAEMIWMAGNEDLREILGIVKRKGENATETTTPAARGRQPAAKKPRGAENTDANSPKSVRAVRWVEVVAEFPHVQQIREYIRALKEPAKECGLRYALAEIQRCELNEFLEWSEWKTIGWSKQFDLYESAMKLDDPLKDETMTAVVPGLVMRVPERATTGESAGGPPSETAQPLQMAPSLDPEKLKNQPAFEDWKPEELDLSQDKKAPPVPKRRETPSVVRQPQGGGRSGSGAFNNYSDVEFARMRAWDFTVQPGKRYQYRIRAVVYNPNYMRPDVVDPEYSIPQLLDGPWSEPSEEVYVEPDTDWFVAEKQSIRDHQLNLVVHAWSKSTANYVPVEISQQTGQVVGRIGARTAKIYVFDPETGKLLLKEGPLDAESLNTREILLEVTPGDVRSNVEGLGNVTIRPPREAIVMNEYGDLIRRSELSDVANPQRQRRERDYKSMLELAQKNGEGKAGGKPSAEKKAEGELLDPIRGDREN